MEIKEIKEKMLEWEDFYGADIMQKQDIKKARTKRELNEIMEAYARHMEDRESDARAHFDKFHASLDLGIFL